MRARRRSAGFTLVESLLAMALVSTLMYVGLQVLYAGHMRIEQSLHAGRGNQLAEALLEEIVSRPYGDPDTHPLPGPEAGQADRSTLEHIQAYHGLEEQGGQVKDSAGALYDQPYQHFSRTVQMDYVSLQIDGYAETIDGLSVTVTVEDERQGSWQVNRFVAEPEG